MNITNIGENFSLNCSRDELSVIGNALNNIPQAVSEQDYSSLIGVSKQEANILLDLIVSHLNSRD